MSTAVIKTCDLPVASQRDREARACGRPRLREGATRLVLNDMPYELDLCATHKKTLMEALAPFIDIARIGRNPKVVKRATHVAPGGVFLTADVRDWLRKNGHDVPPNGRLPESKLKEYAEAHHLM